MNKKRAKWSPSQKHQRFIRKVKKMREKKEVKSWCDCQGTNPGNYQEVETKKNEESDEVCVHCKYYVIWDSIKPRPSESTKDVEVHYLDDRTAEVLIDTGFNLNNYEVEDFDAI